MTGTDIIRQARLLLAEHGLTLQGRDAERLDPVNREVERLLDRIIQLNNLSYPLPGDICKTADISATLGPYSMPSDFWKPRRLRLTDTDGTRRTVHIVPEMHADLIPPRTPAGYFDRNIFYPLDGSPADVAGRTHSWEDADTLQILYVTRPVAAVDAEDTVEAPEDALPYLGAYMATVAALGEENEQGGTAPVAKALNAVAEEALADVLTRAAAYPLYQDANG